MSNKTKIVDLGHCVARYTDWPKIEVMSPASESEYVVIPASSVTIYGEEAVAAFVQMLIEAGLCAPVPPKMLTTGGEG